MVDINLPADQPVAIITVAESRLFNDFACDILLGCHRLVDSIPIAGKNRCVVHRVCAVDRVIIRVCHFGNDRKDNGVLAGRKVLQMNGQRLSIDEVERNRSGIGVSSRVERNRDIRNIRVPVMFDSGDADDFLVVARRSV